MLTFWVCSYVRKKEALEGVFSSVDFLGLQLCEEKTIKVALEEVL